MGMNHKRALNELGGRGAAPTSAREPRAVARRVGTILFTALLFAYVFITRIRFLQDLRERRVFLDDPRRDGVGTLIAIAVSSTNFLWLVGTLFVVTFLPQLFLKNWNIRRICGDLAIILAFVMSALYFVFVSVVVGEGMKNLP
jgi:hypothetical protein